jgi:hypothetical protein
MHGSATQIEKRQDRQSQGAHSPAAAFIVSVISLMVMMAAPVRAEVVTLICQDDPSGRLDSGRSFTLRVDYQRNRLSGRGGVIYRERQVISHSMSGPCRRATQKF